MPVAVRAMTFGHRPPDPARGGHPAETAAFMAPTSPVNLMVTSPPPLVSSYPTSSTFADFIAASAASTATVKPTVSIKLSSARTYLSPVIFMRGTHRRAQLTGGIVRTTAAPYQCVPGEDFPTKMAVAGRLAIARRQQIKRIMP